MTLTRALKDEIAEILLAEHNYWVRYRDKQPPHPKKAVLITRCLAENKIRRLRELIAILSPKKLESTTP